jgi:hypothetical protein
MSARPLPIPVNPTLLRHAEERRKSLENRVADQRKRQVLADHQWQTVQEEDRQNQQLLQLSNQILALTKAIHAMSVTSSDQGAVRRLPAPNPEAERQGRRRGMEVRADGGANHRAPDGR